MGRERRTSGAKALIGSPGTARLKSCPDTEHQSGGYLKRAHFRRFGSIDIFENSSHAGSEARRMLDHLRLKAQFSVLLYGPLKLSLRQSIRAVAT
jgi:hypothetical protein